MIHDFKIGSGNGGGWGGLQWMQLSPQQPKSPAPPPPHRFYFTKSNILYKTALEQYLYLWCMLYQ